RASTPGRDTNEVSWPRYARAMCGRARLSSDVEGIPTAFGSGMKLRLCRFAPARGFYLTAATAEAAGLRLINVPADSEGPKMTGAVWSPCSTQPEKVIVGNSTLPGGKDCPIEGDKLPLVVFSHGRGGNFIGHHDTAEKIGRAH